MNPFQILAAIGDFASILFAVIAIVLLKLNWGIYTNHLPHIYSELRDLRTFLEAHDKWERKEKYHAGQHTGGDS